MGTLILLIVWLVSLYYAIQKPVIFVVIFGLVGSRYDAFGIGSYLSLFNSLHFRIMEVLLIVAVIISIIHFFRKKMTEFKSVIILSILFLCLILISTLYNTLANLSAESFLSQLTYNVAMYSPATLIIWISYYHEFKLRKTFRYFVIIQILISTLVVYLPSININILDVIKGANYTEGFIEKDIAANILNFFEVFKDKYYFNLFAQYHNSNDLGVYGGLCLFILLIYIFFENKKEDIKTANYKTNLSRLIYIPIIILALFAWFNSGNRGVVYGIMATFFLYFIFNSTLKSQLRNILIIIVLLLLLFFSSFTDSIVSYLFLSSDNISYYSRLYLLENGLEYLADHWLFGNGGNLSDLTSQGIDPHQLPIRLSILFGTGTGIVSILIIYILPIYYFIKYKKCTIYSIGLVMIIWATSLTNNYTVIVLFWMAFAEALIDMRRNRKTHSKEIAY